MRKIATDQNTNKGYIYQSVIKKTRKKLNKNHTLKNKLCMIKFFFILNKFI